MLDRLLRSFQARAFREGWRGLHSAWFVIGAALWMVNRSRRRDNEVVFRTKLQPGEGLLVTTRAPGSLPPGDD
jgi:hypothetical protein